MDLNYRKLLTEEIALEGLDGITVPSLWLRLKELPNFPLAIDDQSKEFLWRVVASLSEMTFYQLPEPRRDIEVFHRFEHINVKDGIFYHPVLQEDIYPVALVSKDGVHGSCATHDARIDITAMIRDENGRCLCTYSQLEQRWGRSLVVVASQSQRNLILIGSCDLPPWALRSSVYCVLERIGRSRYNGLTTAGPPQFSLSALPKPLCHAKTLFYIIDQLKKKNLVTKQILMTKTASEKLHSMNNLVFLKPFHQQVDCQYLHSSQKLCDYLSQQPQQMQSESVIRKQFNLSIKTFRRICVFLKDKLKPVSPAKDESAVKRDEDESEVYWRLIQTFDHSEEESEEDGDGKFTGRVGDSVHYSWRWDESYMRQVYQQIYKSGTEGMSETSLRVQLGQGRLAARNAVKMLIHTQQIVKVMEHIQGRRIAVYIAKPFADVSQHQVKLHKAKTAYLGKSTQPAEVPVVSSEASMEVQVENGCTTGDSGAIERKTTDFFSNVKITFVDNVPNQVSSANPIKGVEDLTARNLEVASLIIDFVHKHRVVDSLHALRQGISQVIQSIESMCTKTLRRLVDWCDREGKVKKICLILEHGKKRQDVMLICAVGIKEDDHVVRNAIQRIKLMFFGVRAIKGHIQTKNMPRSVCESFNDWIALTLNKSLDSSSSASALARQKKAPYGSLPKMKKVWILHRFLWYLIYDYQGKCNTIQEPSKDKANDLAGATDIGSLVEDKLEWKDPKVVKHGMTQPTVYADTHDWTRYLAPLRNHADMADLLGCGQGICLVGDLFLVMPISIFCQVIKVGHWIEGLEEILLDKTCHHYPIRCLPPAILTQLLYKRQYLFAFFEVCNILCYMGLLSYGPTFFNDKSKLFIYLKKKAVLLDTRPSLPGYMYTHLPADLSSFPAFIFHLESMADVQNYWTRLQTICIRTDLNLNREKDHEAAPPGPDVSLYDCLVGQTFSSLDKEPCLPPGDHNGAAGMDSDLFMHKMQKWKLKLSRANQVQQCLLMSELNDLLLPDQHSATNMVKKKMVLKKKPNQVVTLLPLQKKFGNKGGKGIGRIFRKKGRNLRLPKKCSQKSTVKRNSKGFKLDQIDQTAKSYKIGTRVKWTAKEISVLLIFPVASLFLRANQVKIFIPYDIARTILHQRCPNQSQDKSQQAVQHKLRVLMNQKTGQANILNALIAAKQDKELVRKYEHVLASQPHSLQMFFTEHFSNVTNDLLDRSIMVEENVKVLLPPTVQMLMSEYDVVVVPSMMKPDIKECKDVTSDADACKVALRDLQMSFVLCVDDKQNPVYEMYSTLRQYPDILLSDTFNQLSEEKLIVRKKRSSEDTGRHLYGILNCRATNNRYKLKFQMDISSAHLFSAASKFLGQVTGDDVKEPESCNSQASVETSKQNDGEVQGQKDQRKTAGLKGLNQQKQLPTLEKCKGPDDHREEVKGQGPPICSSQKHWLTLNVNNCTAGHVAAVIGLLAIQKILLQVEVPADVFEPLDSAASFVAKTRCRGKKRKHSQIGDDKDETHAESVMSNMSDQFSEIFPAKKGQSSVKLHSDSSCKEKCVLLHNSKKRKCIHPFVTTDDDDDEEEAIEENDESSPAKRLKILNQSTSERESEVLLASGFPGPSHLVTKDDDGLMHMHVENICVRFGMQLTAIDRIKPAPKTNVSHTLLWIARKYGDANMPSKTDACRVDKFVMNSCKITLAMKRKIHTEYEFESNHQMDLEASKEKFRLSTLWTTHSPFVQLQDMQTGLDSQNEMIDVLVDKKVMTKIIQRQQKLLPNSVDLAEFWQEVGQSGVDVGFSKKLYQYIDTGGVLGRTWTELREEVGSQYSLPAYLDRLLEADVVVRVGLKEWRYVSFRQARPWLTCTLKNTRGRGHTTVPGLQEAIISLEGKGCAQGGSPEQQERPAVPLTQQEKLGKGNNSLNDEANEEFGSLPSSKCSSNDVNGDVQQLLNPVESWTSKTCQKVALDTKYSPAPFLNPLEEPAKHSADQLSTPDNLDTQFQPKSTYKKVCLMSRMWRKPDGRLNRPVLKSYLNAIMYFLINQPGCSLSTLTKHFHPYFSPVALLELVEILEELGCVQPIQVKKKPAVSLFSKRILSSDLFDQNETSFGVGGTELLFEINVDCSYRLGQFLDFLG